jgi:hypothetical protein
METIGAATGAGIAGSTEYLLHLTRPTLERTAYAVLYSIVHDMELKAGPEPFGAARDLPEGFPSQRSTCLSELPLTQLDELVERRSPYGLGFTKSFVTDGGGARVWYVDRVTNLGREIYRQTKSPARREDPSDFLWNLTPFIDFPGDYDTGAFHFEWEREWRVVDGISFDLREVAFLLLPEADHGKARRTQHIKVLRCPLIDPTWSPERIHDALPPPQLPLREGVPEPGLDEAPDASSTAGAGPSLSWCPVCGPGSRLRVVDGMWRCDRCSRPARPVDPRATLLNPSPRSAENADAPARRRRRPSAPRAKGAFRPIAEVLSEQAGERRGTDGKAKSKSEERWKSRRRRQPSRKQNGNSDPKRTPKVDPVTDDQVKRDRSRSIDWNAPHIKVWRRND